MRTLAESNRSFWHRVLLSGGITTIPRWTLTPIPGVLVHEARIPCDLVAALRRLTDELAVPLSSVLLAAHARVLSALCGECEVVTGYISAQSSSPLPCRLTTATTTWRSLLLQSHRVEADLLSHQDVSFTDLRSELGLSRPLFETIFDPAGKGEDLSEEIVLEVAIVLQDDAFVLRLRYRTEVLDTDYAARICGYHIKALRLLAADPDAEYGRQSLLSAEELHFQLEVLAGQQRELPKYRIHELFEMQVVAHPDAIAAMCGDLQWTYQELNAHANQLGRALLAQGLRREEVVAVVTERNLDWLAAVLAIFKVGGVYLPIEPHFPAGRIAKMLLKAECRLMLTETSSSIMLDQALVSLPETQKLFVDTCYKEGHATSNLGVGVAPEQLAYIYFTSGSSGEPKGVMCEHTGMLNHILAKIADLQISEGQVVAQIAPQCFDISLWQLVSALLVGGRTLLVEQEVILDVERFVNKVIAGQVNVLQVVPSYLEVILSYLEHYPCSLPDLHYVSVTGEALKKEITQRWFAANPAIKLVNAYGLTETSDDTNHEIMDSVPDRERVPLGRPIHNVRIYVVDEHLSPVPLGAPGIIAFAGICVGRGYINDLERTRQFYLADPYHTGQRLYLGGDYGRWLPEKKLEFLGRRDTQVKISGFRIEIGEIENTLLRVPGVHDGAVVVVERPDHSKRLVAFYSGPLELSGEILRDWLSVSLPEYMLPLAFHWRESLPLTANSKIDRNWLTAFAGELDAGKEKNYNTPCTPAERRMVAAWAEVLGVPQEEIGRHDHFFERGGTSLAAVRLAVLLERVVSLREISTHPILADLAKLVE